MAKNADPTRQPIALPIGGMYSGGADPAVIPQENVRLLRNFLHRPGRIDARPPFTYDSLTNITGLARREDIPDQETQFLAMDAFGRLYIKDDGAETWGAPIISSQWGRLTGWTTLRGVFYACFDDGAGNPLALWSYDGTTLRAGAIPPDPFTQDSWPVNVLMASKDVVTFEDRNFYLGNTLYILPLGAGGGLTHAYDWTSAAWTASNVVASVTTLGSGVQVCRLSPQSLTAKACTISGPSGAVYTFGADSVETVFIVRGEARGVDPLYAVPITISVFLASQITPSQTYNVGDLLASGAYRYRCVQAGLTAALPPSYGGPGTDTVDGGAVWRNQGPSTLQSLETSVPSVSDNQDFTPYYLTVALPPRTNTVELQTRVDFFTTASPSLSILAPIDISARDGLADTDPAKNNHGWQWTPFDYFYPFFNMENSTRRSLNIEAIVWTETDQPRLIRAQNTYQPQEEAGMPTGGIVSGGSLIVFKRRALWVFAGQADPDNPILPQGPALIGSGAIASTAIDTSEDDEVFFVGEYECYRYRVGGLPLPICGDEMYEEIMDHDSGSWVEDQPVYNLPRLAIDKVNREVWIYTQRGKLYCFHDMLNKMPAQTAMIYNPKLKGLWSVHDVAQDGSIDISALEYNPVTGKMMVAFGGGGLTRLDQTIGNTPDAIDSRGQVIQSSAQVIFRPVEFFAPRLDALVEEVAAYTAIERVNGAYLPQAGQLSAGISYDGGLTFPKFDTVIIDPSAKRVPLPVWQAASSLTLSLQYDGPLGAQAFAISRAEAVVQVLGEEFPEVLPLQVGSNV